jgi:hypothetical protein
MKRKCTYGLLFLATFVVAALSSCITDVDVYGTEEDGAVSEFQIGTRAPQDDPDDHRIVKLRMMVFDARTHALKDHVVKTEAQLPKFRYVTDEGEYHFFFVANEPEAFAATLNTVRRISDLDAIAFPASAFDRNTPIPMMKAYTDKVVGVAANRVSVDGEDNGNHWDVCLTRMAVRVDAEVYSGANASSAFTGISFTNLPDQVPLTTNYSGTISQTGTLEIMKGDPSLEPVTDPETLQTKKAEWGLKINRVILPANIPALTSTTYEEKAVKISLLGIESRPSCVLAVGSSYNLPYNTALIITGDVSMPVAVGGIHVVARQWAEADREGRAGENRWLNVSEIVGSAAPSKGAYITFSSNQPIVKFRGMPEPTIPEDYPATPMPPVDGTFDLGGLFSVEFTYDPETGSGTARITPTNATVGVTYNLYLEAKVTPTSGEAPPEPLSREIKITAVDDPEPNID